MLSQYPHELEIWREMCRSRVSAFLHWFMQIMCEMHILYSDLHKGFELFEPFVQLLTLHWQKFRWRSKIEKLSQVARVWSSRRKERSSWKCFCFIVVPLRGILLWDVSFSRNRKMVVSAACKKVPSQLLSDETLWKKLQEEVEGGKTVNDPTLRLPVWATDSSEIAHVANHFLPTKLHKSLRPKPLLVTECYFSWRVPSACFPAGLQRW